MAILNKEDLKIIKKEVKVIKMMIIYLTDNDYDTSVCLKFSHVYLNSLFLN